MGGEWIGTTLGEVLTLQRGFDLPETDRKLGPYPVIASTGPVGSHDEAIVQGPGVVIGRSGSLGGGQFIKSDFWPLNTTLWVKDFRGNDRRFCYYLLKSLNLAHFNAGSGVPTLNRNHIHPLPVTVPKEASEQRAIAHILGTLDDKIELNRRMSETLEALARALFKSWFVDFDPVRAKMEGRWRKGESLPGLPADLWEVFPDRMVDSELGEIPEGWEVGPVDDLCSLVENGATPKRMIPQYWSGTISWFKTGELTDGPLLNSEETITEDGLSESSCKLWPRGTILIALYASPTVGRLGILEIPAASNQACSALLVKPEYGNLFLFYSLLMTRDRLQQVAVGAAQQNISQQVVRAHRIVKPSMPLSQHFQKLTENSYRRRVSLGNESLTLSSLRDTLLPKLITGEIRVKNDESFIPVVST